MLAHAGRRSRHLTHAFNTLRDIAPMNRPSLGTSEWPF